MAALRTVFCKDLFAGKVAVVTGGGTGIGKAITTELARLGCKVVIASRKMERLQQTASEINGGLGGGAGVTSLPQRVYPFQCNIRKEEQVEELMKYTVETHGQIDYLVNNGGGQFMSPFADVKTKGWNAVVDTNLNGTYYCLKHAYHNWMRDHGGSIVNIIVMIMRGYPGMAHSSAARAGVDNLTKTLSLEWAHNKIRINSVAPVSPIPIPQPSGKETRLGGTVYSETAAANYPPGTFEGQDHVIPARRLGTVEEVSGLVCFFLSPAASYITGQTVYVDGGQTLYHVGMDLPDHDGFPILLETSAPLSSLSSKEQKDDGSGPKAKL